MFAEAALATWAATSSCRRTSARRASGVTVPSASIASFWRMPATRCRSSEAARTVAAAGLFSWWVSPADSWPSASSFSRLSMIRRVRSCPTAIPSSRWTAIGNWSFMNRANAGASSTKKRDGLVTYTDAS